MFSCGIYLIVTGILSKKLKLKVKNFFYRNIFYLKIIFIFIINNQKKKFNKLIFIYL